jgi:endonuclease/exonuclease/phosphatase family metal-dependent hydrolase
MNEVCEEQVKTIANASSYPLYYVMTQLDNQGALSACQSGSGTTDASYGNAILSRWPVRDYEESYLYDGTIQKVGCVTSDVGVELEICNTHINPRYHQPAQIETATDFVEAYGGRRDPTILGGDFNRPPNLAGLNVVYASGTDVNGTRSSGHFDDADECTTGNPRDVSTPETCNRYTKLATDQTTRKKYDYIFARQSYSESPEPVAPEFVSYSDHAIYEAAWTMCSDSSC